ncbi:MAG: hypothetical protein ACI4S3_05175 [Candidatus Gastranaerophilaceae bacterium]
MKKQFEQLKMLYNQVLATSKEIKKLIENNSYEEALSREMHKAKLIKSIDIVKKTLNFTVEEKKTLSVIIEEIKKQELENLNKLQENKEETSAQIQYISAQQKILAKYVSMEQNSEGSIIDINE